MTDPDDLPLSGDEQQLLRAYAQTNGMPEDVRSRVWERLAVPLPAGPGGGGGGGASVGSTAAKAAAAGASSAATGSAWVVAASVAAVAAVGTAFWRPWQKPRSEPAPAVAAAAPTEIEANPPEDEADPPAEETIEAEPTMPDPEPPAPAAAAKRVRRPDPKPTPADDLPAQLELAEGFRGALNDGANARASKKAAAYLEEFPEGAFAPEAAAVEALAGCRAGKTGAEATARAFLDAHPEPSRLRSKIEQECISRDGTDDP